MMRTIQFASLPGLTSATRRSRVAGQSSFLQQALDVYGALKLDPRVKPAGDAEFGVMRHRQYRYGTKPKSGNRS